MTYRPGLMDPTPIKGFPYALLVRIPLLALALLAMIMLLLKWVGGSGELAWLLYPAVASAAAVLLTGLLQLYAIPLGVYVLWHAPGDPSQLHEAALIAGALHLGLSLFLLWRFSWVT
jgi:hypothetical protein